MISDTVKAILAWLKSHLKSEWQLEDYPIRFEQWSDDPDDQNSWSARIIRWWSLAGVGRTKSEAFEDLQVVFAAACAERESLPRPGTLVPIEFASDVELRRYWGVASRIVSDVLGFDPDGIFVSDGSSLWDFAGEEGIGDYLTQIEELFGKDVSHIESGNLAEIARFISDSD